MTPTTQADGFNAVTYTGNGGTQSVNVGMGADLVWIKSRDQSEPHALFDSIRGANKNLSSSTTNAEGTPTDMLMSFETDGMVLGSDGNWQVNRSGYDYVAWCWDAGSASPSSNTDGSITSTVKANVDKGFSIVSWSGSSSAGTIGHGLSSAPEFIITKRRDYTTAWHCYSETLGNTNGLYLNDTAASTGFGPTWNSTSPTSSVFSVGGGDWINQGSMIAYCFHSVSGYSDIGSYTGTGATGNTVTTGFRPAFVMIKSTSASGVWLMFDNTRSPSVDGGADGLYANNSIAETVWPNSEFSFDDNGFTVGRQGNPDDYDNNDSGASYIYMAFADTRDAAFYFDGSGNKNNWTPNNIDYTSDGSTYDIMLDSPTNNYCVMNPIQPSNTGTASFSEGNLRVAVGDNEEAFGSFAVSSGAYYFEMYYVSTASSNNKIAVGIADANSPNNNEQTNAGHVATTYSPSDIIGVAVNVDNETISFYKNGSIIETDTDWSGKGWSAIKPIVTSSNSAGDETCVMNFGQQPFAYTPPTGYLPLSTSNLPAPSIADGSEHFNTVLYTGDGSNGRDIITTLTPDLAWIKVRSSALNHGLFDIVRGAGERLSSNLTDAEATRSDNLTGFNSDGFTVNSGSVTNRSGDTYVAWNWKANGSGVTNTDGSITSTVSANVDAGFSIVSYTGNNTSGATLGHGLGQAPEFVIIKKRNGNSHWRVGTNATGSMLDGYLTLTNSMVYDSTTYQAFNADTITLGNSQDVNYTSSYNYIAYCFHSVEGYSKFGSYTGNGSTDGPFVHLGFKPAFVMIKRTDGTASWSIRDGERDAYNAADLELRPDSSVAEYTDSGGGVDLLSNGFKLRTTTGGNNASGGTYIYMAFAEHPFGGDSVAPVTAR